MVTKDYHCINDILIRNHFRVFGAIVQCVIGNHNKLEEVCRRFDVFFYLVSSENTDKQAFETALLEIIDKYEAEYLVLANFMRILSTTFIEKFAIQIFNIHRSFLPAFVGASPYKQAYKEA